MRVSDPTGRGVFNHVRLPISIRHDPNIWTAGLVESGVRDLRLLENSFWLESSFFRAVWSVHSSELYSNVGGTQAVCCDELDCFLGAFNSFCNDFYFRDQRKGCTTAVKKGSKSSKKDLTRCSGTATWSIPCHAHVGSNELLNGVDPTISGDKRQAMSAWKNFVFFLGSNVSWCYVEGEDVGLAKCFIVSWLCLQWIFFAGMKYLFAMAKSQQVALRYVVPLPGLLSFSQSMSLKQCHDPSGAALHNQIPVTPNFVGSSICRVEKKLSPYLFCL